MTNYKTMVLCTFPPTSDFPNNDKKYLFYAPAWEQFDDEAIVQVETKYGVKVAKVEAYATLDMNAKEYKLLAAACGAAGLRRVVSKVEIRPIKYKEDEEHEHLGD